MCKEEEAMEKIMFDSNAFSSLLNSNIDWTNFFSKCEGKYEFYVTALQIEELSEIPDSKKRIEHAILSDDSYNLLDKIKQ